MAKKKKANRGKRRTTVVSRSKRPATYRRGGRTVKPDDVGPTGDPGPRGGGG